MDQSHTEILDLSAKSVFKSFSQLRDEFDLPSNDNIDFYKSDIMSQTKQTGKISGNSLQI